MPALRKYPDELRQRAVRMVFEVREQTGQRPGAIARVGDQLGVNRETLRNWVRQAEVDGGQRPGVTTPTSSGSWSWNARTASCAGPMRS
jgi:transposase